MSTLVYVGANVGSTLWQLIEYFDSVYVFEPDPEIFKQLKRKFQQFEWVTLVNAACSDEVGEVDFYITKNRVASSLGNPSSKFVDGYKDRDSGSTVINTIKVNTINLKDYLKSQGVEFINLYYSDCQGSDLNVLKTMKEFIDQKKIGEMYIETHGDGSQIYMGLDNQFSGFKNLLNENYKFIHATMGTYGKGNASPSRVKIDGAVVSEESVNDVSDWDVPNPEWDSYWRLNGYAEGIGSQLRS
jgi:FkbM family methyltransferase|tara:strand:- start:5208 stop:5936 length:729 start_codon:yes stop_codon:yes gene_type:complete